MRYHIAILALFFAIVTTHAREGLQRGVFEFRHGGRSDKNLPVFRHGGSKGVIKFRHGGKSDPSQMFSRRGRKRGGLIDFRR